LYEEELKMRKINLKYAFKLKLIFCTAFLLAGFDSFSQDTRYAGNDGIGGNMQFNDMSGNPISINDFSDIAGSPMLNDDWGTGTIKLKNGQEAAETSLGYSLFDEKLFVKKGSLMYPVNDAVQSFSLEFPENSYTHKINYYFESGFPATGYHDKNTLYQVLHRGKKFTLLKWMHKKVDYPYSYGTGTKREYELEQDYYVYTSKDEKMTELGNKVTLKTLKKNFPKYVEQILSFDSGHKFNAKDEESIIQLFTYLN
jgi:hypothetical protein